MRKRVQAAGRGAQRIVSAGTIFAVWALLAWPAIGDELTAREIVERVQSRYDDTVTMQAEVHQELVLSSAGRTVRASGTVAFKRPGKMHWVLENHDTQIIVADGEKLWFYQPADEQVLIAPFEAAFRSSTPISFLTGVGKIDDDFEVSRGEPLEDGRLALILRPREKDLDVGRLRLFVDPESWDIVGAEVVDVLGNITRIELRNIERNVELDDTRFRLEIPDGVDRIEAPIG